MANTDSKDIVKEIFERQKKGEEQTSSIFSTYSSPPKFAPHLKKAKDYSHLKKLPAAVDIGTSSIKILQLAEDPKTGLEIICIDREPYPSDRGLPFEIIQKEALKKIVGRNEIGPDVSTAILAKDVQIYNLSFPVMSEAELSEAIQWKLKQIRPFGLDIEAIAYRFIKEDIFFEAKAVQQIRVLVVCVPREVIQKRISLFQEAGLRPVGIEVAPVTLLNLDKFRAATSTENEIVMWVDIGGAESALLIARSTILYFCRVLTITSQQMTRYIAQRSRLTEEEAEKIKREHGLTFWSKDKKAPMPLEQDFLPQMSEDRPSLVYYSLVSLLENLVVDIEHSFKYFSYQVTKSQTTKFDRLILSGGGSNLKNLEQFLSAKLNIPVEKIDPFSIFRIPESLRRHKEFLFSSSAEFAVCAALAVSQKIEGSKRIDLIQEKRKKGMEFFAGYLQKRPVNLATASILAFVLLLVGLHIGRAGFYSWKMKRVAEQVKVTQTQLSSLQSKQLKLVKEEGAYLEKKVKLQDRSEFLSNAIRKPEEFSEIFVQVSSLLPDEIWVTRLSYSDKKIIIAGSTPDINLIMQLVETLKTSDKFSNATFSYTQKEPGAEVYNFEVMAEVKG